jgi:hypothetical protein
MARAVRDAGLNPLPILPGKKAPGVKWSHWQKRRMSPGIVETFAAKFPGHNIGAPTGEGTGILVVDVDTRDQLIWRYCIATFGDTPAKVRTASGKLHLYYRCPPNAGNTVKLGGRDVDIRANGGFIVLPPSIRPDLDGAEYEWLEGGLEALRDLPLPKPGSIPEAPSAPSRERQEAPAVSQEGDSTGTRNTDLFAHLRGVAMACASEANLVERATAWNGELADPLPAAELVKTANRVWRYRQEGKLLVPGGASNVIMPASVVETLAVANPDAFGLYGHLLRAHAGLRDTFALSIRAMAPVIRWTERRLRAARDALLEAGLIEETHHGGKKIGDASQFRFG